jgi:HSP20 family protein
MEDKISQTTIFFSPTSDAGADTVWRPAVDVYRTRTGWLVKYDLAGVRREDIEVTVAGRRVTIRGIRRDWRLEEGCSHYFMEISYNRFERTLELPCDLEGSCMELEGREGLLLVRLRCQGDER